MTPDNPLPISPAQISAARAGLGWRQTDLANRAGVHARTIKQIENGKVEPQNATAAGIVRAFGIAGVTFGSDGRSVTLPLKWRKLHHFQACRFGVFSQLGKKTFSVGWTPPEGAPTWRTFAASRVHSATCSDRCNAVWSGRRKRVSLRKLPAGHSINRDFMFASLLATLHFCFAASIIE